jgi:hypothetical protein
MTHGRVRPNIPRNGTDLCGELERLGGVHRLGPARARAYGLRLDGAGTVEIAYADLTAVSIGRGIGDRLGGRTTVVLSRRTRRPLWIAPVAQHAALLELHDRVSAFVR